MKRERGVNITSAYVNREGKRERENIEERKMKSWRGKKGRKEKEDREEKVETTRKSKRR